MSSRAAPLPPLGLALGLLLAACGRLAEPDDAALALTLRLPRTSEGVLLNEPLVLYFDAELDRASVTVDSVRITDPEGRRARGTFEVSGRSLRFVPAPVYARTLDDGGFRPGTTYEVELVGFPDPAALRSVAGAPLARTERWRFRTTIVDGAERGSRPVFQDATPERGHPLGLVSGTLGPREPLYLRCAEPLDPSTLFGEDFRLRRRGPGAGAGEEVLVRARLVPPPEQLAGPLTRMSGAGWVELVPLATLQPGSWRLEIDPRLRLRDYGGNPIWAPSSAEGLGFDLRVAPEPSLARGRYQESFLGPDRRSPLPPPALEGRPFDGTAHWGRTGVAGVRLPAAVGDGSDGEVRLEGREERADVRATRLELDAESECLLAPGTGLVVLRAQGRMQIDGRLVRTTRPAASAEEGFAGRTLSEWLEWTRASEGLEAEGPAWTVLVAGGDLVLTGSLLIEGPLLLVAGGVVRVTGIVQAPPGAIWMLGEGGGSDFNPSRAGLVLDTPVRNPLATTLRLGVLSQSIPPRGTVARWLDSELRGRNGAGLFRVRFLREPREGEPEDPALWPAHDTPRLFEGGRSLVFLVELEIGPGPPGAFWDPPFVDEVSVSWEEVSR